MKLFTRVLRWSFLTCSFSTLWSMSDCEPVQESLCCIPEKEWKVFATGSFISWQPIEEGLDYAITQSPPPAISDVTHTHLHHIHTRKTPGFQVGVGGLFNNGSWDLCLEWTSLDGNYHSSTAQGVNELLFAPWLFLQDECTNISAKWNLDLDLLDFELARYFYSNEQVTLRGFVGTRAAWIDQHLNIRHVLTDAGIIALFKGKTLKSGIGPRFGIDARFEIARGFRFFGTLAGALIYTHDHVRIIEDNPAYINPADLRPPLTILTNKFQSIVPNTEAALGFAWGNLFKEGAWKCDIALSYEFQVFWDQNTMRSVKDNIQNAVDGFRGDLYLHGWILKATLAY